MTTWLRRLLLLALLGPAPLAAQEIAIGERVLLATAGELRFEGILRAVRGDTLWVRTTEAAPTPFLQRDIQALYVRRPETRGQSAWKWAKRGLVAGAAVGVGFCLLDRANCTADTRGGSHLGEGMLLAAIWFGSTGATYAALGGAIVPGTRWTRVLRLPSPTVDPF